MNLKFIALSVVKNAIYPLIYRLLPNRGVLGLEGHKHLLLETIARMGGLMNEAPLDIKGKQVCELGPGRSPQLMMAFAVLGAKEVVGIDARKWMGGDWKSDEKFNEITSLLMRPEAEAFLDSFQSSVEELKEANRPLDQLNVRYEIYSGSNLPQESNAVAFLYSKSVLEHIHKKFLVKAIHDQFRVVSEGGYALHVIDLRDHSHVFGDDQVFGDWLDALRYPEWLHDAMTSNRPAYINRLRESDWRNIFEDAGFKVIKWSRRHNRLPEGFNEKNLNESFLNKGEDFSVSWIDVLLQKPASSEHLNNQENLT